MDVLLYYPCVGLIVGVLWVVFGYLDYETITLSDLIMMIVVPLVFWPVVVAYIFDKHFKDYVLLKRKTKKEKR